MDYEIFKDVVIEKFKDYLPEEYKDMELRVAPVEKVNKTLDGISLTGKESNVSPTIYINDIYEHYQKTNNLDEALKEAANFMVHGFVKMPENISSLDYENAKDNIVFQLVNTEQNKSMLNGMPSREFLDLSIIYRWVIKSDTDGIMNAKVTNGLAEMLGMDEEQLFHCAVENTKRIQPPVVKNMNDIIFTQLVKDGMPQEMINEMMEEIPAEKKDFQTRYIITIKI